MEAGKKFGSFGKGQGAIANVGLKFGARVFVMEAGKKFGSFGKGQGAIANVGLKFGAGVFVFTTL